mmetsp:Transcript_397/g.1147  ORF Transcript_397/g.1147 Transcript_397/m.1147 type:complete len:288 (-) Transcript_397:1002-1865(-)
MQHATSSLPHAAFVGYADDDTFLALSRLEAFFSLLLRRDGPVPASRREEGPRSAQSHPGPPGGSTRVVATVELSVQAMGRRLLAPRPECHNAVGRSIQWLQRYRCTLSSPSARRGGSANHSTGPSASGRTRPDTVRQSNERSGVDTSTAGRAAAAATGEEREWAERRFLYAGAMESLSCWDFSAQTSRGWHFNFQAAVQQYLVDCVGSGNSSGDSGNSSGNSSGAASSAESGASRFDRSQWQHPFLMAHGTAVFLSGSLARELLRAQPVHDFLDEFGRCSAFLPLPS